MISGSGLKYNRHEKFRRQKQHLLKGEREKQLINNNLQKTDLLAPIEKTIDMLQVVFVLMKR